MAISVTKTIPTSSRYTGGGTAETITLSGATSLDFGISNELIKVKIPQSKARWTATQTDLGNNSAVDLKKLTDTFTIVGWLDDDATETAWNKAWKLRAMVANGGPLTSLVIENITFQSGTGNLQAFLESADFSIKPNYEDTINSSTLHAARIEVTLKFYIGNQR